MIQLDTETASNQDIYAAAVTALTHTLPASPVEHLAAVNVQVSALAASVSRALTIRLLADAQEVFKADVLFTSGSATNDKVRWLAVPPLPLRGGQVITITIRSDHASDTAVTLTALLASHDLDYILAFRAAEGSPTADSLVERIKTMDAGVTLANSAHGGAAATLTLQTPVEANAVQISGDGPAADNLETMLDGTGGNTLSLGRLTLSTSHANGAIGILNSGGPAIRMAGSTFGMDILGTLMGVNITGTNIRAVSLFGGLVGLYSEGTLVGIMGKATDADSGIGIDGQGPHVGIEGYSEGASGYGIVGHSTGATGVGVVALASGGGTGLGLSGAGKALGITGPADLLDDTLADTLALDTRLPAIPASQGDVTAAHAMTDGKVDAVQATANALAAILAGITSLAAWLRGMFRKSAMDATAKTEVNSGGGTYDEATDSNEALADKTGGLTAQQTRDAMKLAPSAGDPAAGSVDKHLDDLGSPEQAGAAATAEANIRGTGGRDLDDLATPSDVTAAHATTDGLIGGLGVPEQAGAAAAAEANIRGVSGRDLDDLATPQDVRTTVLPGTLQVRAGTFTLQGASQQTLDLPAGYASTLPLRLVDADEEPVDLSDADLVLRAVDKDGEELFVLTEGNGIETTEAEDGQFTIAVTSAQAEAGRHKYELGDAGSETLYAKGDLVFRPTFGLEAES